MEFKIFRYNFLDLPLLHKFNANEILEGMEKISFDLGKSKERVIVKKEWVEIRGVKLSMKEIEKISKDRRDNIFAFDGERVFKLLFFEEKV